jgi:CubicO group peptidase (beta-lactamase class C family)
MNTKNSKAILLLWVSLALAAIVANARADAFDAFDAIDAIDATDATDAIDDLMVAEMKRQHIPGMSIAVLRGGEVVKAAGYGLASVEAMAASTRETIYEIGSVTKPFTAIALFSWSWQ